MDRLAEVWSSSGHGLKARRHLPNVLNLFSSANYTHDYGQRDELRYPFLDVFGVFKHGKTELKFHSYGPYIKREDVYPLKKVEFLGVSGVRMKSHTQGSGFL